MPYDPERHRRRSIRLKGYDYRRPGAYFVTLCADERRSLFGRVQGGIVHHTALGKMICKAWLDLPGRYPNVAVDAMVLMPNHFHGIIILPVPGPNVPVATSPVQIAADRSARNRADCCHGRESMLALPEYVQRLKSFTTARYRLGVAAGAWPGARDPLWQRNYYEHIVRDRAELESIREYIARNPLLWDIDRDNPLCRVVDQDEGWTT